MSELSINLGFIILGVIAGFLLLCFIISNIKEWHLRQLENKYWEGVNAGRVNAEFRYAVYHKNKDDRLYFNNSNQEYEVCFTDESIDHIQKDMDKKQAIAEQFCDDLQRMKRLEEDSEKFQRLHLVKEK